MDFELLASMAQAGRVAIPRAYIPLLGMEASALLAHMCLCGEGTQEQRPDDICWQLGLSDTEFVKARTVLADAGLVAMRTKGIFKWQINQLALGRFMLFAYALHGAMRPVNPAISRWQSFIAEYPDIVVDFGHLCARFGLCGANPAKPMQVRMRELALARGAMPWRMRAMAMRRQEEEPAEVEPVKEPAANGDLELWCLRHNPDNDPELAEWLKQTCSNYARAGITDLTEADIEQAVVGWRAIHRPKAQYEPESGYGDFDLTEFINNGGKDAPEPSKPAMRERMRQLVGDKPKPKKKEPKKCKFVEHWNAQPDVPICKAGTKAYEACRRFFEAHLHYEAGNCSGFMLPKDEQNRIRLRDINRIPPDAPRMKDKPCRCEKQMFTHIELAARMYQKEYAPENKDWLPDSLRGFLWNNYSKKYGMRSLFLEAIGIRKPLSIDDVSIERILDRATDYELDAFYAIKRLYCIANSRPEQKELTDREFKGGFDAACSIVRKYKTFAVDRSESLYDLLGKFPDFLEWYEQFAGDEIWDGMPITAFHASKDLWRRFTDFVADDIGVDVYTGDRTR